MRLPLLSLALLVTSFYTFGQAGFYSQHWSEVYKYELNQLPKSALAVTDTLYARAKQEKNVPQLVKALIYQSKFSLVLQEDAELLIVHRLEKEIKDSAPPLSNIIENVVASLYWQYFKQHRYKFYQRTHTSEKIDAGDFRTWDLKTLFNEIHTRYQHSLTQPAMLKKVSLASLTDILDPAESSKIYRPTLFDLLSHNALEFYLTDENSITAPAAKFILNDKRYFEAFDAVIPATPDNLSLQFHALKIYHELLAFHKKQNNINAFVDLELQRLNFIATHGSLDSTAQLHKQALAKLKREFAHHAASTLIDFALASIFNREGETYSPERGPHNRFSKREALALCDNAAARFPASDGALKCQALKNNILSAQVNLTTEKFIRISTASRLLVQYKNTDSLAFFAFRIPWHFKERFYRVRNEQARLAMLDSLKPAVTWRAALTNEHDHHLHRTEVIMPPMPQGNYLLLASTARTPKHDQKATMAYAHLQVTNLVMIQQALSSYMQRYQAVDRNTGKPLEGAEVLLSNIASRHNNNFGINNVLFEKRLVTGKTGFIEITSPYQQQIYDLQAHVSWQGDTAVFGEYNLQRSSSDNDDEFNARAFLFTDRSIYRPGQTVYFKGILTQTRNQKSSVAAGEFIDVVLNDANGQEAAKLKLKTNTFGSFSGTFTLPAEGLTGEYRISAEEPGNGDSEFYDALDYFEDGNASFSVEEYKRPTFETTFDAIKALYKAGDTVTVTGSATAFSGALVGGAKVRYRVRRTVQLPRWYYWGIPRYHHPEASQVEITHGETSTGSDGKFTIAFKAIPADDATKDYRPVFNYEVTADITDINGETRSATTSVKAGYHTLEAILNVAEIWNMNAAHNIIAFTTKNLNGQHIGTKGILKVYKLMAPAKPLRPRPWSHPDFQAIPAEEFARLFPHDPYEDEANPANWKRGTLAFEIAFDSDLTQEVKVNTDKRWQPGRYEVELQTTDPSGLPITDRQRVVLHDPSGKAVTDNELMIFELDKPNYKPGDIARLKIGSASADITLVIDIEKDHRIVNTLVEHLSTSTREIAIPITKDADSGFAIHYSSVNYNTFLRGTKVVTVTLPRPTLDIETLTFRDKLQPGARETWSFRIRGKHSMRKEAEVLVSMYDASLDQFRDHQWFFNPIPYYAYYSYNYGSARESFGTQGFSIINHSISTYAIPARRYDHLDWFGLSFDRRGNTTRRYLDRLYVSRSDSASGISKVTVRNDRRKKPGHVYGMVTDAAGAPLGGVSVMVKNTLTGAITDDEGLYMVEAVKGAELTFSYIGYSTASTVVRNSNTIDVAMAEEVQALSEVVVVGYGTQEKRELTGSVVSIKASVQAADTDYELVSLQALEGRVAGIDITNMPGGTARIKIRGQNFADLNTQPLYVIDGVIVASSAVDHNDLASIEVLKGQDALALYGSRGVNGVIVISTKSGQKKLDNELAKVNARVNLNETAFFFPHITTSPKGKISFTFTSPEALTRWKLQLLAHTPSLVSTTRTLLAVTQKTLMVTPNAPRFLRANDEIVLSAKIANLAGNDMQGMAALQLTDAITGAALDSRFGNMVKNQSFKVTAQGSTQVSWKLHIPEGVDAVQYKIVAQTDNTSDGEQNVLPVLPDRMLVTETMPMAIRSGETKTFHLKKLEHHASPTLKHHRLTLEVTANPVWYAVQALPYLMEFPHECAEQTFSRYYANTLATHIGNSMPKIRQVFDQWAANGGTVSNLEKNKELKSVVIQETPWLRDAQSESEQQKRIALLFNINTMRGQLQATLDKLKEMQLPDGGFPWFSGCTKANPYITRHIASGYGHLKHLGATQPGEEAGDMMKKAVLFLDNDLLSDYHRIDIMRNKNVGPAHIQYLYMRSFYPEVEVTEEVATARAYYLKQSAIYWPYFNLHMKAMIALTHHRHGNDSLANNILRSLTETSITSDEMGMYWKENAYGWHWSEAPVETQALIIEAFSEIAPDTGGQASRTLDDLRLWLLRTKQTSQWETTKATTEAIYALLLKGNNRLTIEEQPSITVGDEKVNAEQQPATPEAGTGYFKTSWQGDAITPAMGKVTLSKKEQGITWAGLYWQYFEDLDKVTPAETSLKVTRKLFVVTHTEQGEILTAADSTAALKTGDLLRVRIELKTDRTLEFVHMKDMRAAGLEPVNVLSGYHWQDGLGYYESTKDAATHFFFDEIPRGVYVFQYDLRVNNRGNFSNGITTVQCMYAPEFGSHSEGIRVVVE
jgi:TonB-dependent SusC/RagA subfamily outer membrane receptor